MAIGAPTHSDEDSELSDLDGDDTIGFDSDFRTPSLSAKERAGLAPTLGAGLTRVSGDGDAESFGGDVADPSVAAAPDFGAALCEISCPTSTRAQCAAFSPDGSLLAFGCEDGIVRAHDATTGRPSALFNTATHDDPDAPRGVVTAVRFLRGDGVADDNRANNRANVALVATSAGRVFHWHATSGAVLGDPIVETHNQTFALDVRADGRAFATAGSDATVRAYDQTTRRETSRLPSGSADGGADRIFAVRYLDDAADVVASAGWDNTLTVWDARAGPRPARIIRGPSVCGDAVDARFGNGGVEILTGSWRDRRAVQLWDLGTGRVLADVPFGALEGEKNCQVYGARFAKKGRMIVAAGSGSNEARATRATTGTCAARVAGLPAAAHAVELAPDETKVAVTCADGVRVFETKGW